jgi:lysozyme
MDDRLQYIIEIFKSWFSKPATPVSEVPVVPASSITPPAESCNSTQLDALVTKHEGVRLSTYPDQYGNPTIGIGHNLRAHPLPVGWIVPITVTQAQQLLQQDVCVVGDALAEALPWFEELESSDEVRASVLVDMGFNMGVADLLTFKTFLSLVSAGEYDKAADDLTNTLWAKQVPVRAAEDITMLRTGVWPEGI